MATKTNQRGAFADWLERKYIEWRADKRGRESSQSAFARHLGISPQVLGQYLNGDRRNPEDEVVARMATALGEEIYAVLGRTPSDQYLEDLRRAWPQLTEEERRYIHGVFGDIWARRQQQQAENPKNE